MDLIKEMVLQEHIFHMFFYSLLALGALILEIIVIADNKPMDFCYRCYK